MIKLPLSLWNKLKNVPDFSESNIKNSYLGDSTLRLKGCINNIFSTICCEEVSQIQKTGLEVQQQYLGACWMEREDCI